jgi:hypothetical protein
MAGPAVSVRELERAGVTVAGPSCWRVRLGLRVDDEVAVADGFVADCKLEDAVEHEPAA